MNLNKATAHDIMSEIVVTISENATIKDVAHLMLRDRVSGLPVVNEHKQVVGILTLTDLLKLVDEVSEKGDSDFLSRLLECNQIKVSKVMTTSVVTVMPETTLFEIVKLMTFKGIHTFPVFIGDELVGVVGRRDVLNAIFSFS